MYLRQAGTWKEWGGVQKPDVIYGQPLKLQEFYYIFKFSSSTNFTWYDYYVTTHYRLPEYLVGIIFGYLIHISKNSQNLTKQNFILSYIGWILSFVFIYNHFWGLSPRYFGPIGRVAFKSISRALWSLSICYVIFACHQHQTGGIIRWFLSLNFWQPLSKIGLSIYIAHTSYLVATSGNIQKKSAFGLWWNFMIHSSDFMASIVIGACLYLLVEAPTGKLLNYLCSNIHKTQLNSKKSDSLFEMKRFLGYFKRSEVVETYKELKC